MSKKFSYIISTLLALSLLVGCATTVPEEDAPTVDAIPSGVPVEVTTSVITDLVSNRELSGKVQADTDVAVMSPLPVKVTALYVEAGDVVSEGDVLFVLDKTDIQKQYDPLIESYNKTKELADATLAMQEQTVADTRVLFEAGFASQKELEGQELALLSQQIQFDGQLTQLETSIESVEDTLQDASVRAPSSGVVTSVGVVQSSLASPSAPAVVISKLDSVTAIFDISEDVLPSIFVGQPVSVSASNGELMYDAEITAISPTASPYTNLYTVDVAMNNSDGMLKGGMFVTAHLESERREGVVAVDPSAISSTATGSVVYVVNGDVASEVAVTTGLVSGNLTEVTSGLSGGETVVVKGQSYIGDDGLIRIVGEGMAQDDVVIEEEVDLEGAVAGSEQEVADGEQEGVDSEQEGDTSASGEQGA